MFSIFGDTLKMINSNLQFKSAKQSAEGQYKSAMDSADMVLDNARARLAKGTRDAGMARHTGTVAMSNATAAMAGQGGVTDPVLLAKLQARANYNSIATLFEAKSESDSMVKEAGQMRVDAARGQYDRIAAAHTNLASRLLKVGQGGAFDSFANYLSKSSSITPAANAPGAGTPF